MSKFMVISRPNDDFDSCDDLYEVQHNSKGPKAFENAWDKEVQKAKKANPEEWCVDQVIKALEKKHWVIKRLNNIIVTY